MASTKNNISKWLRNTNADLNKARSEEVNNLKQELRLIAERERLAKQKVNEVIKYKTTQMNLDPTNLTKRLGLVYNKK